MDIFERIIDDTTLSGVAPLSLDYVGIFDGYVEFPEAYRGEPSVFTTATGVISGVVEKAEGSSVGAKLSVRSIVHAIRLMSELAEKGRSTKFISVKVCKSLLYESELYESLTAVLNEESFDTPEKICLEFPSDTAEGDEAVKRGLAEVKAAGFSTAISSVDERFAFALLTDIKVDYVFLSPSVTAIAQDRSKTGVLTAIIGLLHTMGVNVIAEGVINDDEIRELTSVECFGFIPAADYKGEFMLPIGARSKDEVLSDSEDGL